MIEVYKLLARSEHGLLSSMNTINPYGVVYPTDGTSAVPVLEGSLLFAFRKIDDVRAFLNDRPIQKRRFLNGSVVLWLAEGKLGSHLRRRCLFFPTPLEMERFWRGHERGQIGIPSGTVLVSELRLKKQLEIDL